MSKGRADGWRQCSRRNFLRTMTCAGVGGALQGAGIARSLASQIAPAAFEQIPPSASGISWTHVSGRSPMAHLPETVGPGCAFLDYDNDGWMDIYLVNSGPCDFFQPAQPLRNALYHNNPNRPFTDATAMAGIPGKAYGIDV